MERRRIPSGAAPLLRKGQGKMQLYYEGTDITGDVEVTRCVHRDMAGGRCDSADITLENAAAWYRWKPRRDDRIEIRRGGYTTGTLYLNAILPEEGRYRIVATSLPSAARQKRSASYENMTLADMMAACGAECGMGSALYGLDGSIACRWTARQEEGPGAFLSRIIRREGGVLKAVNGRFTAIGVLYAQGLKAGQLITLTADQPEAEYIRREDVKYSSLTIETPYAGAIARDTGAAGAISRVLTCHPATDGAQAGRWARGLLLMNNRQGEQLTLGMAFNAALTAMIAIEVEGQVDGAGSWLAEEVEHDFVEGRSRVKLLRQIKTIG